MISWRSYTTSKLLPTFVGEVSATASTTLSFFRPAYLNFVGISQSGSTQFSANRTRTVARRAVSSGEDYDETVRSQNSLFRSSNSFNSNVGAFQSFINTIVNTPVIVRQETTTTVEDVVRAITTVEAEGFEEDGEYDEDQEDYLPGSFTPYTTEFWTTSIASQSTVFTTKSTETTSYQYEYTFFPSSRTVTTTFGEQISFVTYTGVDGDIQVVEHTIIEYNRFGNQANVVFGEANVVFGEGNRDFYFATFNFLQQPEPVTALSYAPTRITLSYYEEYSSTLHQRNTAVTNTVSESTTTYLLSGEPTQATQENITTYGNFVYPWTSETNYRRYTLTNSATTLHTSTTRLRSFNSTYEEQGKSTVEESPDLTKYAGATSTGEFFIVMRPRYVGELSATINARLIKAADIFLGVASPELTFDTKNTHSTVGGGMSANNVFSWNFIPQGNISRGVANALPLYPTFTAVSSSKNGSRLSESTDHTSITGQYEGPTFTTTAKWKSKKGSETQDFSVSGTFSLTTLNSFPVGFTESNVFDFNQIGFRRDTPKALAGGFMTPHASHTSYLRPGCYLLTTFDGSISGTTSSYLSTGTTEIFSELGFVPVSVISQIFSIAGYGFFETRIADQGLP